MDNHGYDPYENEGAFANYGFESDSEDEEGDDYCYWDSQGSAIMQDRQNSLNPYRYINLIGSPY